MNSQKPSCNTCQLAFFIDYGYSNYTVEGTFFCCGGNHHPNGTFDRWYGEDKRLTYATKCQHYIHGKPVEMDVERDNLTEQKMTPAQLIMWRTRIHNTPQPTEDHEQHGEAKKYAWEDDTD